MRSSQVTSRSVLWISMLGIVLTTAGQAPSVEVVQRSMKAQDFMRIFGVNVHFHQNNYRNVQAIADALNIVGFSRVRSSCVSPAEVADWEELAAKAAPYFPRRLKADVLVIGYRNAPGVTWASQRTLIARIADHDPVGQSESVDQQRDCFAVLSTFSALACYNASAAVLCGGLSRQYAPLT